jgi:hypothetical protein
VTPRWTAAFLLATGLALLAGCGGADANPSAGSPSTSAAAPSVAAAEPTGAADGTPAGTPTAQICAFLEQKRPEIVGTKTAEDASAVLAINLATFASENVDLRSAVNSQLDELTTEGCADTRTALLEKLGADSFTEALSLGG